MTITEADREVNETLLHLDLAEVLSDPEQIEDFDRDDRISVLDLYLTLSLRVLLRYQAQGDIPTEHAQLDDNGDQRPTELQLDFLERELGGRAERGRRPEIRPTADGALAARTPLNIRPSVSGNGSPAGISVPGWGSVPGMAVRSSSPV